LSILRDVLQLSYLLSPLMATGSAETRIFRNCTLREHRRLTGYPPLPIGSQTINNHLMHHGILAERRQIYCRFSHVEWVDLLAAENFYR
jgi:hypothetical protein